VPYPQELVLVKLGGSLITDKRGDAVARHDVIERLAAEVAAARRQLAPQGQGILLGHGSGSFGHVAASRFGLGEGLCHDGERGDPAGVAVTQDQAAKLHRIVVNALLRAGERPFSIVPSSTFLADRGRVVRGFLDPLLGALAATLLPVVYGDVVVDRTLEASICSTEEAVGYLVGRLRRRGFRIRRLLWCGVTDGVYDREGRTIPRIDAANTARTLAAIGETDGTDVTGGMLLRVRTARRLAGHGVESRILNGTVAGQLTAGLLGEDVAGTHVVAES
jgi:isopentenyl phosphate kinase